MGWECGVSWGYATKLNSAPTLAKYTNDTGATKVVKSFWCYLATGNGRYNAGDDVTGNGSAISFYVTASDGTNSVTSTTVSVTNKSTPLTSYKPDGSVNYYYSNKAETIKYEVTFGSGITVPNGGTVSIIGSYNDTIGHNTQVLIFYDSDSYVGGSIEDPYVTCAVTYHRNRSSTDTSTKTQTFRSDWAVTADGYPKFGYDNTGAEVFSSYTGQFGNWDYTGHTLLGWNANESDADDGEASLEGAYVTVYPTWTEDNSPSVDLYAAWRANVLKVYYNANGGSIPSNTEKDYKLSSSDNVYKKSTNTRYHQDWTYNNKKTGGLINPKATFDISKKGHTFLGWALDEDETEDFLDPDNVDLQPTGITTDIEDGDCSVTLYAGWRKNALTIYYNANGGVVTDPKYVMYGDDGLMYNTVKEAIVKETWYYGNTNENGLINRSTLGLEKEGCTFLGWKVGPSGEEIFGTDGPDVLPYTPIDFTSDIENGDCEITMYAAWKTHELKVYYHANGGVIDSTSDYILNSSNMICTKSDSEEFFEKWYYGEQNSNGLYDNTTFKLTRAGYIFAGWKVGSSGTRVFDMKDDTLYPTDFTDDIKTGDCEVTMYAVWLTSKIYIMSGGQWTPYLPEGTTMDDLNSVYKVVNGEWKKVGAVRKRSSNNGWTNL